MVRKNKRVESIKKKHRTPERRRDHLFPDTKVKVTRSGIKLISKAVFLRHFFIVDHFVVEISLYSQNYLGFFKTESLYLFWQSLASRCKVHTFSSATLWNSLGTDIPGNMDLPNCKNQKKSFQNRRIQSWLSKKTLKSRREFIKYHQSVARNCIQRLWFLTALMCQN